MSFLKQHTDLKHATHLQLNTNLRILPTFSAHSLFCHHPFPSTLNIKHIETHQNQMIFCLKTLFKKFTRHKSPFNFKLNLKHKQNITKRQWITFLCYHSWLIPISLIPAQKVRAKRRLNKTQQSN